MRDAMIRRLLPWLTLTVVALLVVKYFWTTVAFPGVPFGYDAGIYRFLFIREAAGWPPFHTPDLPEWAKSHAPGLFFFTSPLVNLGLSPDWLIGWVWNAVPIALALVLASSVRRREGATVAFFVLVCSLLSVVQLQGFLMMYYKVFLALLLCTLAITAFDERRTSWIPLGMLSIAIHQQIGLIFAVSTLSSIVMRMLLDREFRPTIVLQWLLAMALGACWYIPTYRRSIGDVLPQLVSSGTVLLLAVAFVVIGVFALLMRSLPRRGRGALWWGSLFLAVIVLVAIPTVLDAPELVVRYLFRRMDIAGGAFLGIPEYLKVSAPLLLLGLTGLTLSLEQERGSARQWAVLWCGVAVLGMFFFYRRFLLPLDFFLLPFAAIASARLVHHRIGQFVVGALLLVQAGSMTYQLSIADPHVERAWLQTFASLHKTVPTGSTLVVLDNMAPWVVGYLPEANVSGPGIFDSRPYEEWEKFLLGSEHERRSFIEQYSRGTFFFASDVFFRFYPPEVQAVLRHPCFVQTDTSGLVQSVCGR